MATSFCDLSDSVRDDKEVPQGKLSTFTFAFGEASEDPATAPQAYLVEMFGPMVGPAHFHPVDQFQIFFPHEHATYQRTQIAHPLVHYTDAYSVYGPFATAQDSMQFFTLRARQNKETILMPEGRDRLIKRGKRNFHTALDPAVLGDVPAAGEVVTTTLFEPTEDHMSAVFVAAGEGATIPTTSTDETSGRYTCVLEGELRFEGRSYGPQSIGWSTPGSEAPELTAGAGGVRLVLLTFPYPSTELLDLDPALAAASSS
jgi:hypothetical protein